MLRKSLVIWVSLAIAVSIAVAADVTPAVAKLSATDIADKNVAARGGLQAWRAVQTMTLAGKLGAGGNQRATLQVPAGPQVSGGALAQKSGPQPILGTPRPVEEVQLPFLMELARPRKLRFELEFNGQTAIQVFDGANGWKLRPFLGRRVVEPYTPDEMKTTATQADLDGPLVDYAAKGTTIALDGMEKVEDRDTYKLKLTFLEAKIEGQPRRLDGTDHPVEVYFRDFRPVSGLQIPFILETRVLPVTKTVQGFRDTPVPPERTIIDRVVVNPKFDDSLFSKPEVGLASNAR
jgi:hypothetical protein